MEYSTEKEILQPIFEHGMEGMSEVLQKLFNLAMNWMKEICGGNAGAGTFSFADATKQDAIPFKQGENSCFLKITGSLCN